MRVHTSEDGAEADVKWQEWRGTCALTDGDKITFLLSLVPKCKSSVQSKGCDGALPLGCLATALNL